MKKRKNTKKRKNNQRYRLAPMPSWFDSTEWGVCRWCNKPILKEDGSINKRRRWHPDCLHDYLIITDHRYAKRQVKKRDKGICANCGVKCRYRYEWELDHVIPLADIPRKDLKYWRLSALQILCVACHRKKTIKENAKRRQQKTKTGKQRK